jgi:chromate transporter
MNNAMQTPQTPTFAEAIRVWLKIGLLSFGGPAGQIALMHRILVDEKRWVDEGRFLHALNFCMLLPGPEAQQLATYIGWLLHGIRGGLVAGLLFVIPGALVILALSGIYVLYSDLPLLAAIFLGVKSAVLIVVIEAVLRIGKRVLKNGLMKLVAALAFVAIFFLNLPFPLIVLGAGLLGAIGVRAGISGFAVLNAKQPDDETASLPQRSVRSGWTTLLIGVGGGLAWFAPIALAMIALGGEHVLVTEGLFFSKLAVVTFGGAYAVLAYMAQQAVEAYAWLSTGEMMDGLGLAESTPGPLIMVTQFVGFLASYRNAAPFEPMTAGVVGSALTVWVTFVPCFLWIFMGAPYVERVRENAYLSGALSTITAAVVGVVVNLSVWFGMQVLFAASKTVDSYGLRFMYPDLATLNVTALILAIGAGLALLTFHVNVIWVLVIGAAIAVPLSALIG